MRSLRLGHIQDISITLVMWLYFGLGFLFGFAPFYLASLFLARDRKSAFQRLNCYFYRGFFGLCRYLIPRHTWQIDPAVRKIKGAVIVCNHVSYLDSILMVSLYPRHTTIAKARLFGIPVFGPIITWAGYIPSSSRGKLADLLMSGLEAMPALLAAGGNLFAFPEGTRNPKAELGKLNRGVFKIARKCRAPIKIIRIENTQHLFPPGQFSLNTRKTNTIRVKLVGEIDPEYQDPRFSLSALIDQTRLLLVGNREV